MDTLLFGGRNGLNDPAVFLPEEQNSYDSSAESGANLAFVTREISPLANGGDVIFKRLYITISYFNYLPAIDIYPVVDGQRVTEMRRRVAIEPGAGVTVPEASSPTEYLELTRLTVSIPLARYIYKERGNPSSQVVGTQGLRGSTIQLDFRCTNPKAHFYLEAAEVHFAPASQSRQDTSIASGIRSPQPQAG